MRALVPARGQRPLPTGLIAALPCGDVVPNRATAACTFFDMSLELCRPCQLTTRSGFSADGRTHKMLRTMVRSEDARFLTGTGRYTADLKLEGCLEACLLRSPHAHARIDSIDVRAAMTIDGVKAVLTGAELESRGIGALPADSAVRNRDGSSVSAPPWRLLASDTVRHVGEAVAMVVADTEAAALDAVELIEVVYEPLLVSVAGDDNVQPCVDWEIGDAEAVGTAFDAAAEIVSVDIINNRVVVNPLETRAAVGMYELQTGRYTLYTPSQGVHLLRKLLAQPVLGVNEDRLRVVTHDVGGGFGMKFGAFPEQGLVLVAARILGRAVRWVGTRSEAFVADAHGRDNRAHARLALDSDGRFLALKIEAAANLGAYLTSYGVGTATVSFTKMAGHVYRIPAIHVRVKGWLTNTAPIEAYRGAGTPEMVYLLERLIERAAHDTGADALELRRRNLVTTEELPYTTPVGCIYEDGDFAAIVDAALQRAEWASFDARRTMSRKRGLLRGIAVAPYVKVTSGEPGETASVSLRQDGLVEVRVGTQDSGQGHATAFAMLVAERLEIPVEEIIVIQGDSDYLPSGAGTGGSSSLVLDADTLPRATHRFIERARDLAADVLEAAVGDVEYVRGWLRIVGTDRELSLRELAPHVSVEHPCAGDAEFEGNDASYPNGAHVCEVEIDPDTGVVTVERFTAVDDIGHVWHPQIAAGQVHGGVTQGIGQALYEHTVYDVESGQLVTGSFMDYCLPRADDLPCFDTSWRPTATLANELGVKGIGEQGPVGAPPAVMNAIANALGVDSLQMPATSERVWRAIKQSRETGQP